MEKQKIHERSSLAEVNQVRHRNETSIDGDFKILKTTRLLRRTPYHTRTSLRIARPRCLAVEGEYGAHRQRVACSPVRTRWTGSRKLDGPLTVWGVAAKTRVRCDTVAYKTVVQRKIQSSLSFSLLVHASSPFINHRLPYTSSVGSVGHNSVIAPATTSSLDSIETVPFVLTAVAATFSTTNIESAHNSTYSEHTDDSSRLTRSRPVRSATAVTLAWPGQRRLKPTKAAYCKEVSPLYSCNSFSTNGDFYDTSLLQDGCKTAILLISVSTSAPLSPLQEWSAASR